MAEVSLDSEDRKVSCPICNNAMVEMHACHMFCHTCGSHLDCSDKGSFW